MLFRSGEIPASVAGETPLMQGDLVTAVNGEPVATFGDLARAVSESTAPVELDVIRDGEDLSLDVTNLRPPYVAGVRPLSAASRAGIRAGDLLLTADGQNLPDITRLQEIVQGSEGEPLEIVLRRDAQTLTLEMIPTEEDVPQPDGSFARQVIIGVSVSTYLQPQVRAAGPVEAVTLAVDRTISIVTGTFDGIGQMISGNVSPTNLQGPVGIAQVSGETAGQGLTNFIMLIALISTAIGLMNLFPIPVLDGGHLVFYAIEEIGRAHV